jgi:hypothetical protein
MQLLMGATYARLLKNVNIDEMLKHAEFLKTYFHEVLTSHTVSLPMQRSYSRCNVSCFHKPHRSYPNSFHIYMLKAQANGSRTITQRQQLISLAPTHHAAL